nr:replication protein RepA [Aureimonas phyllosphaerae]
MDPNGNRIHQPIPWGPKARLIMAHLSTEALRNNSPVVETADTLTGFMHDMGFTVTGGERGSLAPFKEQLRALAACRMEFSAWDGSRSAMVDVKPLEKVELWFGEDPAQRSLWPSKIEFSHRYFEELQKHALPIDKRALKAFSGSARRLDLLFWITFRITRLNDHFILDWKPLKEQFGEGFARDRDFRAHLVEDLASIKELFPKLPVKLTARGLEMDAADSTALAIPKRTLVTKKA